MVGEILVTMSFTERDLTAMHAEVEVKRKRLLKLILVREIAASHRSDEMTARKVYNPEEK